MGKLIARVAAVLGILGFVLIFVLEIDSLPVLLKKADPLLAGRHLSSGRELIKEGNYLGAVEEFRKAADAGSAEAKTELGDMYSFGRGVERNYEKSFKWFRAAALAEDSKGMLRLGQMYLSGKGTQKNEDEAIRWFQRAKARGNKEAEVYLNRYGN